MNNTFNEIFKRKMWLIHIFFKVYFKYNNENLFHQIIDGSES